MLHLLSGNLLDWVVDTYYFTIITCIASINEQVFGFIRQVDILVPVERMSPYRQIYTTFDLQVYRRVHHKPGILTSNTLSFHKHPAKN